VFLFHRPIWTVSVHSPIWTFIDRFGPTIRLPVRVVYLVVLGVPSIFAVGYWIQVSYDSLIARLSSRLFGRIRL
jgi:hypothetical protein